MKPTLPAWLLLGCVALAACDPGAAPPTKPKPKAAASASPPASPGAGASPSPGPTGTPTATPSPTPTPTATATPTPRPSATASPAGTPTATPSAAATDAAASAPAAPKSTRELFTVGRKLQFKSTYSGAVAVTGTLTQEVTAVTGDVASLKVTNLIAGQTQVTQTTLDLADPLAMPRSVGGPSPEPTPAPVATDEAVTVPYGAFSCVHQHLVKAPDTEDRYFATGFGMVKQVVVTDKGDGHPSTTTIELVSYE